MAETLGAADWSLLHGSPSPPPERIELRAGPVSLRFEPELAFLRYVRVGGREVLRGVYAAVRDRDWGTVAPQISDLKVECSASSFRISFDVTCREREIDFRWHGLLTGTEDGTVTYTLDGRAHRDFLTNRIGFCVLHPDTVAGQPCAVEHTDGTREEGAFPGPISPHQPFLDIRAIIHPAAPGVTFEVRMEGDTFEMEDQRNWTDASYKTYCTPLAIPYPVPVREGASVRQRITLRICGAEPGDASVAPEPIRFEMAESPALPLPRLGLCLASDQPPLTAAQIDRLRALQLSHVRIDLRLAEGDAETKLEQALHAGRDLGTGLELAVFVSPDTRSALETIANHSGLRDLPSLTWLVFPAAGKATTEADLALARECVRHGRVVVGTDAYFTELNRNRPPAAGLDGVCYSVNPQVHAFDDASLVETLGTQGTTVESTRRLYPGLDVFISPVTLRPRSNPDATSNASGDTAEAPANVDPRQQSLFAAGWTLGSWKSLAEAGARSITWFETHGPRGVMAATTDEVYPVYHVFCALAGLGGGQLVPVRSSDPLRVVAALIRQSAGTTLFVANLGPDPVDVLPPRSSGSEELLGRCLDGTSAKVAACDPEAFLAHHEVCVPAGSGTLLLRPYSLTCLEWQAPGTKAHTEIRHFVQDDRAHS